MAKADRTERKEEPTPAIELEGEPHPADLLASLNRADNPGGAQPVPEPGLPISEVPQAPAQLPTPVEPPQSEAVPVAARALAAQPTGPTPSATGADPSSMERTLKAFGAALPTLQRLAPLLEGNALPALLGLLAPHPQAVHTPHTSANQAVVESGLAELKAQQKELRGVFLDQDASLRRLTDQIQLTREATERNTLEQQEMIEELKSAGRKMNVVALLAFALLAGSIAVNVYLYFEIHKLLP